MKRTVPLTLLSLMLATLGLAVPSRADDVGAAVARWDAAWAGVHDFYDGTHTHITKGRALEDRTLRVWFKKPMNIRSEVLQGNRGGDTGSVAVYTGGDKVTGHQGGLLSSITLSLGLDDPKTTSVRGGRITDLQFGRHLEVIHMYLNGKARMDLSQGTVAGHAVTILSCRSDNRDFIAGNHGVARDVFAYDNALNVPVQWLQYEPDGTEVTNVTYYDVRLNVGVPDSAFQVRTKMTPPK